MKGGSRLIVTVEDLVVPDLVSAGTSQLKPVNWPAGAQLEGEPINLVGESFRQEALDQIGVLTKGSTFEIWLCPEPQNEHDKHAVRVMAGRHQIGYISKVESALWSKRALPLWLQDRYLTGEAWGVDDDPVWQGKRGARAKVWWPLA